MKNLNVRFEDEDLHQRVKDAATEDRRSLNSEILWIIERGLDARDAAKADS
jgi:predicted HicB family RNase H-like nuclease